MDGERRGASSSCPRTPSCRRARNDERPVADAARLRPPAATTGSTGSTGSGHIGGDVSPHPPAAPSAATRPRRLPDRRPLGRRFRVGPLPARSSGRLRRGSRHGTSSMPFRHLRAVRMRLAARPERSTRRPPRPRHSRVASGRLPSRRAKRHTGRSSRSKAPVDRLEPRRFNYAPNRKARGIRGVRSATGHWLWVVPGEKRTANSPTRCSSFAACGSSRTANSQQPTAERTPRGRRPACGRRRCSSRIGTAARARRPRRRPRPAWRRPARRRSDVVVRVGRDFLDVLGSGVSSASTSGPASSVASRPRPRRRLRRRRAAAVTTSA